MDGMPLTLEQISTFHDSNELKVLLDDLVQKGYLRLEHPKALVEEKIYLAQKGIGITTPPNQKVIILLLEN